MTGQNEPKRQGGEPLRRGISVACALVILFAGSSPAQMSQDIYAELLQAGVDVSNENEEQVKKYIAV